MITYAELKGWADRTGIDQAPAEIHGLMTGWLCAGASFDAAKRRSSLSEWLDIDLPKSEFAILDVIYNEIAKGLDDDEFGFRLLLPGDDVSVNARTSEVACWCQGFLYGFGMTGRFSNVEVSEDVAEVLKDLGQIAAISEEIPDGEENEADLIEISEYIRMSAMLIHSDCTARSVH